VYFTLQRLASLSIVVLLTCILAGCIQALIFNDIPTYPQDQMAYYDRDFQLKIENAYWADASQTSRQPQDNFLVIDVSITNVGAEAAAMIPPAFTLVSERGAQYISSEPAYAATGLDSLIRKVSLHQALRPNKPVRGKIIFDVPKGSYKMIVSLGSLRGTWSTTYPEKNLFRYSLAPTESKRTTASTTN
jgi:hypothetical protein